MKVERKRNSYSCDKEALNAFVNRLGLDIKIPKLNKFRNETIYSDNVCTIMSFKSYNTHQNEKSKDYPYQIYTTNEIIEKYSLDDLVG